MLHHLDALIELVTLGFATLRAPSLIALAVVAHELPTAAMLFIASPGRMWPRAAEPPECLAWSSADRARPSLCTSVRGKACRSRSSTFSSPSTCGRFGIRSISVPPARGAVHWLVRACGHVGCVCVFVYMLVSVWCLCVCV